MKTVSTPAISDTLDNSFDCLLSTAFSWVERTALLKPKYSPIVRTGKSSVMDVWDLLRQDDDASGLNICLHVLENYYYIHQHFVSKADNNGVLLNYKTRALELFNTSTEEYIHWLWNCAFQDLFVSPRTIL